MNDGHGSPDRAPGLGLVGATARELAAEARAAGWSVRVSVHPTGHGSREVYLDEAFAQLGVEAAGGGTR